MTNRTSFVLPRRLWMAVVPCCGSEHCSGNVDAIVFSSGFVSVSTSLHRCRSSAVIAVPVRQRNHTIFLEKKKAVLSQGNRAMQRVYLPTPNDSSMLVILHSLHKSRWEFETIINNKMSRAIYPTSIPSKISVCFLEHIRDVGVCREKKAQANQP